jgi:hypothetical protein
MLPLVRDTQNESYLADCTTFTLHATEPKWDRTGHLWVNLRVLTPDNPEVYFARIPLYEGM